MVYYQGCSGPLYCVPTRLLDDPNAGPALAAAVEVVADTPPTGGTTKGADGSLFISDTDGQRVLRVAPDGTQTVLAQDPRLFWVDAMWIDGAGRLLMPAAQLNRVAVFNGGASRVRCPMVVFTLPVGTGPAPNDHR